MESNSNMNNKIKKIVLIHPSKTTIGQFWNKIRRKEKLPEIIPSASNPSKEGNMIDKMVYEARLEYLSGKTKGFTDTKKLIEYLEN